jgi:hypothetical protein
MSAPSDPAVTANPSALPYATAEVRSHHPFAALGTGHHLDRTAHVTHLEPLATCTPRSWSNPTLERTSTGLAYKALLAHDAPRGPSRFWPSQLKRWASQYRGFS